MVNRDNSTRYHWIQRSLSVINRNFLIFVLLTSTTAASYPVHEASKKAHLLLKSLPPPNISDSVAFEI